MEVGQAVDVVAGDELDPGKRCVADLANQLVAVGSEGDFAVDVGAERVLLARRAGVAGRAVPRGEGVPLVEQ